MSGRPRWMQRADEIAAQSMGQFSSSPESSLTAVEKADPRIIARINDQVFYCEGCGYYWDTDQRHVGDLCDECHDEREDGMSDE